MKGLYSFNWNCGRMGEVSGMFIADSTDVEKIQGKYINFGEILGKHSEVYGNIRDGDIVLETNDESFIDTFESVLGAGWSTGYNPLDYYDPERDDE